MSACSWGFLPTEIYLSILCGSLLMVDLWIAAPLVQSLLLSLLIEHLPALFWCVFTSLWQPAAKLSYQPGQSKLPSRYQLMFLSMLWWQICTVFHWSVPNLFFPLALLFLACHFAECEFLKKTRHTFRVYLNKH